MNSVKKAAGIFGNYIIILIIYIVFLYTFISITGEKFVEWLPLYSFLMFLLLFYLIYNDMKTHAVKETRPQYNLNPHPLKGLIIGLFAAVPIAVLEIVYLTVVLGSEVANYLKKLIFYVVIGPLYFIIGLFGETLFTYLAVFLLIPVIAMLGYLAGYYKFSLRRLLGKEKSKEIYEHKFPLSPWNPNAKVEEKKQKKK